MSSSPLATGEIDALKEEYQKELRELHENYEQRKERRNCLVGVVTSTKNDKTITVTVTRQKLVKKYRSYLTRRRRFQVHDEEERANLGDLVRIIPSKKRGARKNHALIDILIAEGQLPSSRDHVKNLEALLERVDPIEGEASQPAGSASSSS